MRIYQTEMGLWGHSRDRRKAYYRDEGGAILYDSEPEEGKPEWMILADKAARRRHGIYN